MEIVNLGPGRRRLHTGTPWEEKMGYSRAVQVGPLIQVAGCVGVRADGTYPEGLAAQTARCLERVEDALAALGAGLTDLVKIRIYTTRIGDWEEIASVLGPALADIRPANVLVEVAGLVDGALVEIEAEAWVS